jgi:serine/threonine-protein kinase RsbW
VLTDREEGQKMKDRLKFSIPGKPEYVGTVRIAIAQVAGRVGFDIEAIEDIKVAVSEACTNIVCHSHESSNFTYDVVLEIEESKLTILVKDTGVGFGMTDSVPPVSDEMLGGGLGLFIIRALMDEVDIQSEPGLGTDIRMIKYLQSRSA